MIGADPIGSVSIGASDEAVSPTSVPTGEEFWIDGHPGQSVTSGGEQTFVDGHPVQQPGGAPVVGRAYWIDGHVEQTIIPGLTQYWIEGHRHERVNPPAPTSTTFSSSGVSTVILRAPTDNALLNAAGSSVASFIGANASGEAQTTLAADGSSSVSFIGSSAGASATRLNSSGTSTVNLIGYQDALAIETAVRTEVFGDPAQIKAFETRVYAEVFGDPSIIQAIETKIYDEVWGDKSTNPAYETKVYTEVWGDRLEAEFLDAFVSQPLTWLEVTFRDLVTKAFAEVHLNDRTVYYFGYKAPRVVSFLDVTRGLSDRLGQLEHIKFGARFSDTDYFWRTTLADAIKKFLLGNPLTERMIDDLERRLEHTPRIIAVGYVDGYSPDPNLQLELTGSDWVKLKFNRKAKASLAWQPRVPTTGFPANCPADSINRTIPIIYGPRSDANETTITVPGNPVCAGGGALPDITNLTSSVTGGGSDTRRYAIAAVNADGRETKGIYIDVPSAPSDAELQDQFAAGGAASRWVELRWDAIPCAAYYAVYGRGPTVLFLDASDVDGTGPVYFDGKRPYGIVEYDIQKDRSPKATNETITSGDPNIPESTITTDSGKGRNEIIVCGTRTDLTPVGDGGAEEWWVFLGCCHAVASFDGGYLDGVRQMNSSAAGPFCFPGETGWNTLTGSADTFRDIDGQRYTFMYGRKGTDADKVADGSKKLTWNCHGVEETGDGTGTPLTHISDFARHFAINFLATDGPRTTWVGSSPDFPHLPGVPLVDAASFADVKAAAGLRVVDGDLGSGVIGAGGEEVSALDALARMAVSGDFDYTFTRKGTLKASSEPISKSVGLTTINDIFNIKADSFRITEGIESNFFNIHPFVFAQDTSGVYGNTTTSGWLVTDSVQSDASISSYGRERQAPQWQLYFCDNTTDGQTAWAYDSMRRKLARTRDPQRSMVLTVPFSGLSIEPGEVRPISHIEGIGPTGYTDHDIRFKRHIVQPTGGYVNLEAYDLEAIFNLNGLWTPDGTPDWTSASEEEKRIYLFYCQDDYTYTDGSEAKGYS